MKGLYWYFDKDLYMLIGGGIGGGKIFIIFFLIYVLCCVGEIEICDLKNLDLMVLGRLFLFEGKVYIGKMDIVNCIKNVV